ALFALLPTLALAQGPGGPPPVPDLLPPPLPAPGAPTPPTPLPPPLPSERIVTPGPVRTIDPRTGTEIITLPSRLAPGADKAVPGTVKYFDDPAAGKRGYTYIGLDGKVHGEIEFYDPLPEVVVVRRLPILRRPLLPWRR